MGRRPIIETGNRYGKLVVKQRVENSEYNAVQWLCGCDCGNTKICKGVELRAGRIKSCGCAPGNVLPPGQSLFNQIYKGYKYNAKKRGYKFDLTKEDFSFITQMNCHYCGIEPAQVYHTATANGSYTYNGIDRIDNSGDYTLNNIVPCCGRCNRAKNNMSVKEFRDLVSRIIKHRNW